MIVGKVSINNNFSEIMFGRKSVRVYDEHYKIPKQEMLDMIEEADHSTDFC